jgi:hypothetical protein
MRCITDANIWIDLDDGGLLGRVFDVRCTFLMPDLIFAQLRAPEGPLTECTEEKATRKVTYILHNHSVNDIVCY